MAKTMLDQIATNRALYDAARGGNQMGKVSAIDALHSAALIQRQVVANADGYSYRGGSYGSFVKNDATDIALTASLLLQEKKMGYTVDGKKEIMQNMASSVKTTYSYTNSSYGKFLSEEEVMQVTQVIDGTAGDGSNKEEAPANEAPKETKEKGIKAFLKKYKLWVIAAVCAALYFVLRKK